MERNFEINEQGHNIRCKLYFDKNRDVKKIVVCCHGFAGHKDNGATQKFAEKILQKYKGIAVVSFNWPCHGDDVKKKLTLQDCNDYLSIVVNYLKTTYQTEDIFAYGTSFGGYLILKYIAENGNPFKKIVLRCPAVNIHETLMNSVIKADDADKLEKGKNVLVGFDRKIEVNKQFFQELKEHDIRDLEFLDYADDILILHGTKDEVVSHDEVYKFSEDNVIEFISVEGADHRFQHPKSMEIATKSTISFFGF